MIATTTGSAEGRSVSSYLDVSAGGEGEREGMTEAAAGLGADAIIGLSLDYEGVGDSGSMLDGSRLGSAFKLA